MVTSRGAPLTISSLCSLHCTCHALESVFCLCFPPPSQQRAFYGAKKDCSKVSTYCKLLIFGEACAARLSLTFLSIFTRLQPVGLATSLCVSCSCSGCLKKHLNAFRPSEHSPVRCSNDSYIQRIVLATEELTATQHFSHRSIKCQSRCSWSRRGTKVIRSHHGDIPLLKPTGIQIATKLLPGLTNQEDRKLICVKTMYLGTNYCFYCLKCCLYFRS